MRNRRQTRPPSRVNDGRDRVDQGPQTGGIVRVGGREAHRRRDAGAVHDQIVRGVGLAAVGLVGAGLLGAGLLGAGLLASLVARTLQLSRLARFQSMADGSPSQVTSLVCSVPQTPVAGQSRSRRQQVEPLPQPGAFGSKRHGQERLDGLPEMVGDEGSVLHGPDEAMPGWY